MKATHFWVKTTILSCMMLSSVALAMGDIHAYAIVTDGKYIDVKVNVDCTGCWWSETAYIKGDIILRGKKTEVIPINTSTTIHSGQYNSNIVNLATLDNSYNYSNAVINIAISGANTKTVRLNDILRLR